MANVYLNVDATGSANGTSEADAYTTFKAACDGLTFGDTLWIKAGSTAYVVDAASSSTRVDLSSLDVGIGTSGVTAPVSFRGYSSVTGDNPIGESRPVITLINNAGNQGIDFPRNCYVSDLRFEWTANTYQWNYPPDIGIIGVTRNCKFLVYDAGSEINPRGQSVSLNGYIDGCEFDYRITTENSNNRPAGYEWLFYVNNHTIIKNSVFKTASSAVGICQLYEYGYQSPYLENCVFIGNGDTTACIYSPQNTHRLRAGYDVKFLNCCFYNMGNAFVMNAPYGTELGTDTEEEWTLGTAKVKLNNCIFDNCANGIVINPYTDPASWASGTFSMDHVIHANRCAFSRITTANTSGGVTEIETIQLTSSPFVDPENGDFAINETAGAGKVLREQQGFEVSVLDDASTIKFFPGSIFEKDFRTTDTSSLSLGTGGVGDKVNLGGKTFQLVQNSPRVWRWT